MLKETRSLSRDRGENKSRIDFRGQQWEINPGFVSGAARPEINPGFIFRRLWLLVGAAALVAFERSGVVSHLPVTCPLRAVTGIPCAACGLTRAGAALSHGDVHAAWLLNPASFPVAAAVAVFLSAIVFELVSGRAVVRPFWQRYSRRVVWLAVAIFVAAWAINILRYLGPRA